MIHNYILKKNKKATASSQTFVNCYLDLKTVLFVTVHIFTKTPLFYKALNLVCEQYVF